MKRLIACVLCLLMVTAYLPYAAAADLKWPEDFGMGGRSMPFQPPDKYVSQQNPPDFSWGKMNNATSYDLRVCRDAEMTEVAYEANGIKNNYYNFPTTFETGTYYWSVRYKTGSAESEWTQPRRFRIDPDAWEFAVPSLEEMLSRVPKSHPRIWATPETVNELRNADLTPRRRQFYDMIMETARGYLGQEYAPEPTFVSVGDLVKDQQRLMQIRGEADALLNIAYYSGFAYLLSGDRQIGENGAKALEVISGWDAEKGATSYKTQDQVHRSIAYKSAMAYDWLYDVMTGQQRDIVKAMIKARTTTMTDHLLNSTPITEMPYESHGWTAYGYIGIIAVAMYDEIPEAKDWLSTVLTAYINILPPYSYQDGGWSQGTGYWQYSSTSNYEFMDVLDRAGIFRLDDKTWARNEAMFPLYMQPKGSIGAFGDESYSAPKPWYAGSSLARLASVHKDGIAKWGMEQIGEPAVDNLSGYLYADYQTVETTPPVKLPRSKMFRDINWAALHSDLLDPNRISLFFKSSPYGSYNHSHTDQNSFIIQAYGQPLAIDSGYYDAYHSTHDSGYTRRTYAHNAITVDGGKGQKDDDFEAKGRMISFLNHPDFDLVSGDATRAYNGSLGKAIRHIVYIRPDMYLVIDDLQAKNSAGSVFEWWLNAQENISLYESGTGARTKMGVAVLDTKVQYPKVTGYYSDRFSGPDLVHIPAAGSFTNSPVQKRVWFETEKLPKTTMVTTLDVHKAGENPRVVKTTEGAGYIKMEFYNGTSAIVKTGDAEQITVDGITFDGPAVVCSEQSMMLVMGTTLVKDGKTLVESDKPISVVMGKDEVGIYADDDSVFSLGLGAVSSIADYNGRPIGSAYGISMTQNGEMADFTADKGSYALALNGKPLAGDKGEDIVVDVTVDGQPQQLVMPSYVDGDGLLNAMGNLDIAPRKYKVIDKTGGVSFANGEIGDAVNVSSGEALVVKGGVKQSLTLQSVERRECTTEVIDDHEGYKAQTAVWKEAEEPDSLAGTAKVYNTRAFMSGGAGITLLDGVESKATYTLRVPEDGSYDFVIKYVAWMQDVETIRTITLGAEYLSFICPPTAGYGSEPEEWKGLRVHSDIPLKAGEYTFDIECLGEGGWNIDWIGLVKN